VVIQEVDIAAFWPDFTTSSMKETPGGSVPEYAAFSSLVSLEKMNVLIHGCFCSSEIHKIQKIFTRGKMSALGIHS